MALNSLTIVLISWSYCFSTLWENFLFTRRLMEKQTDYLYSSYSDSSCFDSLVIDLTVIAAHDITMLRPFSFAFQLPSCPAFLFLLSCLQRPPPCWGDLPCLLTDNSDRKLLHVITLLKSQFTQPQQIILRWVPRVMETVFSTLHPASPAPPKPRRSL